MRIQNSPKMISAIRHILWTVQIIHSVLFCSDRDGELH